MLSPDNKEFLRLFMNSQKSIYAYILSLVPDRSDAEDLFQETTLLMWDKFDEFEDGTNFVGWGLKIARFKAMNYYKSKKNRQRFDDGLLRKISESYQNKLNEITERQAALEECLEKLNKNDRKLIKYHYEQGLKIAQLKSVMGHSVHSLYRSMTRIHELLYRCVNRTINEWHANG